MASLSPGLPAGLGGPDWPDAVESEIARHVFAIPAVKALGFGDGAALAALRLSNREIAEKLHLSEGSVKQYISQIYSKLAITGDTRLKRQRLAKLINT